MKILAVVVLVAALAGCSASSKAALAECGSGTAVAVQTAYRQGRAVPEPHRVDVGTGKTVRITVLSDVAAEIHVHGYDLEFEVPANVSACRQFVADRAGLFDVEAHPDTLLFQLEVR